MIANSLIPGELYRVENLSNEYGAPKIWFHPDDKLYTLPKGTTVLVLEHAPMAEAVFVLVGDERGWIKYRQSFIYFVKLEEEVSDE